MKKTLQVFSLALITFCMSGCAAGVRTPAVGIFYTNVKASDNITSNTLGNKVASGEIISILGIVATGDGSVETIAKKAGIKKVSHIDYESSNILGIYAKLTIFVYGE